MTGTGWLLLAVYLVGYLACWRTLVWHFVMFETYGHHPDGFDVGVGVLLGTLATLIWPLVLTGVAVRLAYTSHGTAPIKILMPRAARRAAALDAREARITALEHELGIHE